MKWPTVYESTLLYLTQQQNTEETKPEEEVEKIEVIGHDDNTHVKILSEETELQPKEEPKPARVLPPGDRPETPNTKRAFEALAAVTSLQEQLLYVHCS